VTTSKQTTQDRDQQILAGIQKDLQSVPSLLLGGTTYTPGSLAAFIQSRIDAVKQVNTARTSWQNAVKTYQAINTEAKPVVRDLRNFVMAAFGEASPVLADFGFTPARTPETEPHVVAPLKGSRKQRKAGATKTK
jgi:hypothetical protein